MSEPRNLDGNEISKDLSPAARELEAALLRLQPVAAIGSRDSDENAADLAFRDRLMFRAGEAAGQERQHAAAARQVWEWRGVAAVLAMVTVAMFARAMEPVRTTERIVYVPDERSSTTPTRTSHEASLHGGLPNPQPTSDRTLTPLYESGDGPDASFVSNWSGVRGDYLTTRAAVLRWGVAALPSERVIDPDRKPAAEMRASALYDQSAEDERPAGAGDRESQAPQGSLKRLKQWFSHTVNGGRL